MNIDIVDTKARSRHLLEKYFPRAIMNYRIMRKIGFEEEIALLPQLCDPRKASLDVGANIGIFTWHLMRHSLSTMAFEPNPYLSALLRRTFRDNVPVQQVALSNRRGRANLSFPSDEHGLGSIGAADVDQDSTSNPGAFTSFDVEALRLDDLELPPVGFVKIDVEGHELEVLEGAQETIQKHRPSLLVEIEERHRPGAIEKAIELLSKWNYAGSFMVKGKLRPVSEFRQDEHQNLLNINDHGDRTGTYVNNFIFAPEN